MRYINSVFFFSGLCVMRGAGICELCCVCVFRVCDCDLKGVVCMVELGV